MSGRCGPATDHHLCITLSLKGALTIEFPHPEWAIAFHKFLDEHPGEEGRNWDARIRGHDSCHVRVDLTESVDRVQFLGTDEYGGSVIFAFKDVKLAQEWLKCSGLWLEAGGDKLKLPSRWSHARFEKALEMNNFGEKDRVKGKDVQKRSSTSNQPDFIYKKK